MNDPDPSFLFAHATRPPPPASPDFDARVLQQVARCRRQAQSTRILLGASLPLLLLGFFLWAPFPPRQPSPAHAARFATAWLLAQQAPDGGWSAAAAGGHDRFSTGVSALATLALLRTLPPASNDALLHAGDYLLAHLNPEAGLHDEGPSLYNHLLSLRALIALQQHSPHPTRARILSRSLRHLARLQHPDGGWGYGSTHPIAYDSESQKISNVAITWWVLHLLRDGADIGIPPPPHTLAPAEAWLTRRGASYQEGLPPSGPDSALYWMARLHNENLPHAPDSIQTTDAYRDLFRLSDPDTSLSFQTLLQQQLPNGAWSRPDDRWHNAGGQVYTTAASLLCLTSATPD